LLHLHAQYLNITGFKIYGHITQNYYDFLFLTCINFGYISRL